MKKFLMISFGLFFLSIGLATAQDSLGNPVDYGIAFNLSTFTGIVAVVSLLGTQAAKLVPAIAGSTVLKILSSVTIGVAASLIAWALGLATFLSGVPLWQALLCGLGAGLSASGAFDLIKAAFRNFTLTVN